MKQKKRLFCLGILAAAILNASATFADNNKISIEEVLKATLDTSPAVQQIEATLESNRADAFEAKTLSNPELEAEYGVPTDWKDSRGDNEISVSLTHPFKLSQGSLRSRFAKLIEESAGSQKEQELLELVVKTRLIYARLWLLSERQRILEEVRPKVKSLTEFVSSGLKQGAYGKGDDAVFRTEVAKTEAELLGIKADKLASEAELTKLTGQSFEGKTLLSPGMPNPISHDSIKAQLEQKEAKIQRRTQILLNLAKASAKVAERDSFPELRPKLFYSRTNDGVDVVGVGLSFDLPFYSQNTAERMRANSGLHSVEAQANFFLSDAFKTSVLKSVKLYDFRREELLVYEKRVSPAIKEALNAFEEQVRGGEGSVFQLWQTLREYLEVQERYQELWARTFSEYQELSILLGQEV